MTVRTLPVVALAALILAPALSAQGPGVENGAWTYLGGDAWHTRYTPADQITASNFDQLGIAWEWNAMSFGPSTSRHIVGRIVNFALDPSILITTGAVNAPTTLVVADATRLPLETVNTRHENADVVDDILYESEDSYVTARTAYIQNRRRFVTGETDTEQLPDIFD